jgi:hypothetical protein
VHLRTIFGFVQACLTAGLTMVLRVYTQPPELVDLKTERLSEMGLRSQPPQKRGVGRAVSP